MSSNKLHARNRPEASNSKLCSGPCKRTLEVTADNFRKDRTQRSGFKSRCKRCSTKTLASTKWPSVEAFDKSIGRAAFDGPPPAGYLEKGRSTLYNRDGEVVAEWVKTSKEQEDQYKALVEAIGGLADKWEKPKATKKPSGFLSDDLLTLIPLGDPHLGLHCWDQETGQNFDLGIAESNLFTAVDHLVGLAPRSKQALLISLGDFFHADNNSNQTTKGTRVDVDTRWAKVLRIGIRTIRRCIDRLLETHELVKFISVAGNHDAHTSIMLALAVAQYYENEPRVEIDTSPGKFQWVRFGSNLIGTTHGDTVKMKDLPTVMTCDRAKDWGETIHRYFYTGHVHHQRVLEAGGVIMESFRTLAPGDAWHRGQGYRSGQDLNLDVIHKKYGRINRHTVGINQIWDL
jgi:hypothetical protein